MGNRGQTTAEYIVLIGIITAALFYMGPLFKRGVQSLVKVTSDQIGAQQDAEQDFKDAHDPGATGGYLVSSNAGVNSSISKKIETPGFGGVADMTVDESTNMTSDSRTNLGNINR
ncbi:MAG: class III signal peptide-containing protein [Candidatus Omnitrophica bacterium]|nr:class III signal peptide-containing protein [Candidatus Omnitrophota bacterium]